MKEVSLLDATLSKTEKLQQRCALDVEHYEHVRTEILTRIGNVQLELRELTSSLVAERIVRQNKEEYECLARKINECPDRCVFVLGLFHVFALKGAWCVPQAKPGGEARQFVGSTRRLGNGT
jgi:hypothetical protein